MRTFRFRVDCPNREPLIKSRQLTDDAQAVAYARQLLTDWPECAMIDVLQGDILIDRIRPTRA